MESEISEQTIEESSCPCKDCLCIIFCKNKSYLLLFYNCELVCLYLPNQFNPKKRNRERLITLYKVLDPFNWILVEEHEILFIKNVW